MYMSVKLKSPEEKLICAGRAALWTPQAASGPAPDAAAAGNRW